MSPEKLSALAARARDLHADARKQEPPPPPADATPRYANGIARDRLTALTEELGGVRGDLDGAREFIDFKMRTDDAWFRAHEAAAREYAALEIARKEAERRAALADTAGLPEALRTQDGFDQHAAVAALRREEISREIARLEEARAALGTPEPKAAQ